jgi:hypothetical protein
MHSHHVANAGTRGTASVTRSSDCRDVAAHNRSRVPTACFLVTHEFDLRRFYHCVGRLNHGRKAPAFDHS